MVEASPTPISYKGEYHVRSGSTKQQLTGNAFSTFLLRRFGRHWDDAPVPNVGMLKRAALLLFHEDPERWVTGAWVKLGMFRGGADLAYHDDSRSQGLARFGAWHRTREARGAKRRHAFQQSEITSDFQSDLAERETRVYLFFGKIRTP